LKLKLPQKNLLAGHQNEKNNCHAKLVRNSDQAKEGISVRIGF